MSFFDFLNGSGKKESAEKTGTDSSWQDTSLLKEIKDTATAFQKKYNARYPGLDYSVESLKLLEELLADASGFYEEMNAAQQQKIITGAGAYIFEVARKNFGGTYYWYQKTNQPILVTGQPKFEASILAFAQVKNRLQNGIDDNIPAYFESYAEGVNQQRSAIII